MTALRRLLCKLRGHRWCVPGQSWLLGNAWWECQTCDEITFDKVPR